MTHIAVAIVNYNTCEQLRLCLQTVQSENADEVIVVDNGSNDGSQEMVQSLYPSVELLVNTTNPGYGGGANQGITRCTSAYILLLNSDTRLEQGTLQALSNYLDRNPRAGVVGPRLANPDGSLQASCYPFPTPLHVFLEETTLGRYLRYIPFLREQYLRTWSHSRPRVVPFVLGAALAIRRTAFEQVGGFDESYFMYSEEVDLCYRLKAAGWEIHFAPVTTITHIGGVSTAQKRAAMREQFFASSVHFYQQHYSRFRLIQLLVIMKVIVLIRLLRDLMQLSISKDKDTRTRISQDIIAWQRVLTDYWQSR